MPEQMNYGSFTVTGLAGFGLPGSPVGTRVWHGTAVDAGKPGASGGPGVLIWACEPDPIAIGPEGADEAVRSFLAAGVAQRRLSEQTDGRVAPVRDLGVTSRGAYRVTDGLSLRLSDLIDARVRPTGAALKAILTAVLEATASLEAVGRGHGRLTPGRVLLQPVGGGARWRAVLDDAAEAGEAKDAESDLRGVGRLLYELVVLEAYRPTAGYPLEESSGFRLLGRSSSAWLALTNTLLDPSLTYGGTLTSADVLDQLSKINTKESRGHAGLWIGLAAAVLIGGGGFGAWYMTRPQEEPVPVVLAEVNLDHLDRWGVHAEAWGLAFRNDRNAGARDRLKSDAELARGLVEPIEALSMDALNPLEVSDASVRSMDAVRQWLLDNTSPLLEDLKFGGSIQQAYNALEGGSAAIRAWSVLARAKELEAVWAGDRGWSNAASYVRGLVEPLDRDVFDNDLASDLTALLDAAPRLESIEERYGSLVARAGRVAAAGAAVPEVEEPADEMLLAFEGFVSDALRVDGSGGDDEGALAAVEGRLSEIEELAAMLEGFVGDGWRRVERELFAAEGETLAAYRGGEELSPELYGRWVVEAGSEAFRSLDPADDPRNGWGAPGRLAEMESGLRALRAEYPAEAEAEIGGRAFDSEIRALRVAVGETEDLPWKRRFRERVEASFAATDNAVLALERDIEDVITRVRVTWAELVPTLEGRDRVTAGGVASLDRAYRDRRDELIDLNRADENAKELRRQEAALREFVIGVESALSAVPEWRDRPSGFSAAGFDAARRARLDTAASAAVEAAAWDGSAFASDAAFERELVAQADAVEVWLGEVVDLAADYAEAERIIEGVYLPDEPGADGRTLIEVVRPWRDGELLGDETVRSAVGESVDRAEAVMEAWEARDPGELATLATRVDVPIAVASVAYARVGEASLDAWPEGVDEMERDLAAWGRVTAGAEAIGDAVRRAAVVDRARATALSRVEKGLGSLDSAAEMEAGLGAVGDAGVPLGALPAWVRFNAALAEARRGEFGEAPEDEVRALAGSTAEALGRLSADIGGDAARDGWIAEVAALAEPPEDEGPALEPESIGPGEAGWTAVANEDFSRLTYTGPDGAGGQVTLEFAAVEMENDEGDPELVYFCTTEVSIRVLNAIVATNDNGWRELAGAWPAFNEARVNAEQGVESTWIGARSWRWDAGLQRLVPTRTWLTPTSDMQPERPAYPANLGDADDPTAVSEAQGRPSVDHPVNFLAPDAAELAAEWVGARLPTEEEWAAAYARYESDQPASAWNLRDEALGQQRAYLNGLQQGGETSLVPLPEEGSFVVGRGRLDAASAVWAFDDRRLWFDVVEPDPGARGQVLRGLIGNVGELGAARRGWLLLGGSAFSAAGADIAAATQPEAVPSRDRRNGYSDIGFRLVFSAEGALRASVNRQLARLLESPPYVLGR
jgi:hypothetical protein